MQEVAWSEAVTALRALRTTVFIQEQQVPEKLEWDGLDDEATHALARATDGAAIGCARLLLHGTRAHIGRMAVLPAWRGKGVGRALLTTMLNTARAAGVTSVFLNAQLSAAGFYARAGFQAVGEEFLDAGIPHIRMQRAL